MSQKTAPKEKIAIQPSEKPKIRHLYYKISLVSIIVIIICLISIVIYHYQPISLVRNQSVKITNSTDHKTVNKPNVATISAQASPSATPKPAPAIPANSGRSVNVPILMYHYIGNNPNPADKVRDNLSVAPDVFEEEMKYIASSGYTTISLDTLYAALKGGLLPAKPILLTFDDGYIDFYVNAYQILKRYHLHATSFIPTGLMDQGYYLHWGQISEMDSSGLISFEAHSVNHVNLISLDPARLTFELTESKKVLEAHLGKKTNFMAYPYGISDAAVWEATKRAGYMGSVGTWFGATESEGNVFDMPRIKIPGGLPIGEFAKRI